MIKQRHPHGLLNDTSSLSQAKQSPIKNDPVHTRTNSRVKIQSRGSRWFIKFKTCALFCIILILLALLYYNYMTLSGIIKSAERKANVDTVTIYRTVVEQLLSKQDCASGDYPKYNTNLNHQDHHKGLDDHHGRHTDHHKDLDDHHGRHIRPGKQSFTGTMSCPCGKSTSVDYKNKMIEFYGDGTYDIDKIKRCLSLSLPLKAIDPSECWPKLIIVPSHPTNGSGLARLLLHHGMGVHGTLDHYNDGQLPHAFYDLGHPFGQGKKDVGTISTNCSPNTKLDTFYPIAIMNQPAIFKSHLGIGKKNILNINSLHHQLLGIAEHGKTGIGGVIRLARNPGDQLLHNRMRWRNSKVLKNLDGKERDNVYEANAKDHCKNINVETYLNFHSFWGSLDKNVPQAIMHYEDFANKSNAIQVVDNMLDFLNVTKRDNMNILSERVQDIVKEPSYVHGTHMAELCGKDEARRIHELTKDISEPLGYVFDYEKATWSLKKSL